jgi:hypothetical protein
MQDRPGFVAWFRAVARMGTVRRCRSDNAIMQDRPGLGDDSRVEAPRILYAGPGLAGATTSLARLVPGHSLTSWEQIQRWTDRLEGGVTVELPSGRASVQLLRRHFGTLHVRSVHDAAVDAVEPTIRARAGRIAAQLRDVVGVVFVVDSQRLRIDAGLEQLQVVIAELERAGRDVAAIPFVFQLNKRDSPQAVPRSELTRLLFTPRCVHAESVASLGHGVHDALDLVLFPRPVVEPHRAPPMSPRVILQTPMTRPLTADGAVRAELELVSGVGTLVLGEAVALGWLGAETRPVLVSASGTFRVDLVRGRARFGRESARAAPAIALRLTADVPIATVEVLVRRHPDWGHVVVGSPTAVEAAVDPRTRPPMLGRVWGGDVDLRLHHASVRRPTWTETQEGNLVVSDPSAVLWLGRDGAGRVCEIGALSDAGRSMLGDPDWRDGSIFGA